MSRTKLRATILVAVFAMIISLFGAVAQARAIEDDTPLPIEVITDPSTGEIRKVYELSKSVSQSKIPVSDFERGGKLYEMVDILRIEIAREDAKDWRETIVQSSKSKDDATVGAALPPEMPWFTDDGYEGVLRRVDSTLTVETSGTGTSSQVKTTTRTYANLPDRDTSRVPKSIDADGKTWTLSDVRWNEVAPSNPDDPEPTSLFTCVATYSATFSSSYVTGYTLKADYVGTLTRPRDALIRYTVIFAPTSAAASVTQPTPSAPETSDVPSGTPNGAASGSNGTNVGASGSGVSGSAGTNGGSQASGDGGSAARTGTVALLAVLITLAVVGAGFGVFKLVKSGKLGSVGKRGRGSGYTAPRYAESPRYDEQPPYAPPPAAAPTNTRQGGSRDGDYPGV